MRYKGTKTLTAKIAAMGSDKLKTKVFQSFRYAMPGNARYDILETNVAKIDIVTTHLGILRLPSVKADEVLFFL